MLKTHTHIVLKTEKKIHLGISYINQILSPKMYNSRCWLVLWKEDTWYSADPKKLEL